MSYIRRVRLMSFVLTAFCAICASQTTPVELTYSLESKAVSAREPVNLKITIKNGGGQPIAADFGLQGAQNFTFTVVSPDGGTKTIVPPLHEGLALRGDFEVLPGKSVARQILLTDWFDFTTEGQYRIDVRLTSPITNPQGLVVTTDPGAELSLDVLQRDDGRLQEACKRLLVEVASSGSYAKAESAARKLAAINDPIAVPYLLEATSLWHLEPITIRALGQIGDATAVDALIGLLPSGNSDAAALARSTLMQLRRRITDPSLQDKVRRALESKS